MKNYILLVDCKDETGLIHKITGIIYNQGLNIINNNEFVEEEDLNHLLEQLAENMYNYNLARDYSPDYDHYHNYKLREQLNIERNKALSSLAYHRGSFL